MKKTFLLAAICAAIVSCGRYVEDLTVDLTEIGGKNISLTSSDLYSSIKYIPLETNENCYLTNRSIFAVDDENILIWDKEIMRFSIDGHFLNQIGKTGNGHGEHGQLSSVNYDRKDKVVYAGTYGGVIYKYGIDGQYLGQIEISTGNSMLMNARFDDRTRTLVCEVRNYHDGQVEVKALIADTEGKVIGEHVVYSDTEHVNTSMYKSGILRKTDEGMMFMLPFDDRLFLVGTDSVKTTCTLYRGSYSPDREMCENWDNSEKLYTTKYLINNLAITNKNIYIDIPTKEGQEYRVIADHEGDIIYCTKQRARAETYIKLNDFDDVTFWPWITETGNKAVACLAIEKFQGKDRERLKKISKTSFSLNDSSNPVVVIATEK